MVEPGVARAVWRIRKLQRVTASRAVQEFCESGVTFGNASRFRGGLDFGQIAVARRRRRPRRGARFLVDWNVAVGDGESRGARILRIGPRARKREPIP